MNKDPNDRKRLDAESFMRREQEIWRLRLQGMSVCEIESALGCPRTTVHRAIKKLTKELAETERELSDELDAALSRYDGVGPDIEDVRTAEEAKQLNALERHRARYLPPDHPARAAIRAGDHRRDLSRPSTRSATTTATPGGKVSSGRWAAAPTPPTTIGEPVGYFKSQSSPGGLRRLATLPSGKS